MKETPSLFVTCLNAGLVRLAGRRLRLIQVVEYPKCGGTWMARMLRSYLRVDRKHGLSALVRKHSVIQTHQLRNRSYYRNVAVIRDPRDVWVSFYFHERYLEGASALYRFSDERTHAENLLRYMRQKLAAPEKSTPWFSYGDFLKSWKGAPDVCWLRYEGLQANAVCELRRTVEFLGLVPEDGRLAAAVEENRFDVITGRRKGEEDVTSHKRKGIVGDWRNYFTREMGRLVHERQPFLYDLGYERDASWLEELAE